METTPTRPGETTGAGDAELASPQEIWAQVFERVRKEVDVATVWIALQAVEPLGVEGSYFVGTLPPDMRFLAGNLENDESATAIETALREITGRILAFHLIQGQTMDDWMQEKTTATLRPISMSAPARPMAQPAPAAPQTPPPAPFVPARPAPAAAAPPVSSRTVYPTWEKLDEHLAKGYKVAPLIKYAHGQARYLMECVQSISDTMDVLMPPPGQPRDELQERHLAKTIDRLGNVLGQLDSLFIALELWRYRQRIGRDIGLHE